VQLRYQLLAFENIVQKLGSYKNELGAIVPENKPSTFLRALSPKKQVSNFVDISLRFLPAQA